MSISQILIVLLMVQYTFLAVSHSVTWASAEKRLTVCIGVPVVDRLAAVLTWQAGSREHLLVKYRLWWHVNACMLLVCPDSCKKFLLQKNGCEQYS